MHTAHCGKRHQLCICMDYNRYSPATALGRLRLLSWVEGISYLLLFMVTMPLKYAFDMPEPNRFMGILHGGLFIGYVLALVQCSFERGYSFKTFALGFIASLFPFATFWAERKLFN